ncbi:MAG: serine/threonine-protein phosphatase [Clostridiales bacterium]|nr:serine/threonine-protein phosphatase [Clostridiales bacterium]
MKKLELSITNPLDKLSQVPKSFYIIFQQLFCVIASFVISQADILNGMSPFGMAFVAGAPTEFLIGTTLGAIAGYAIPLSSDFSSLRYIATVICIAAVRYCLRDIKNIKTNSIVSCCVAFSGSIITGFATGFTKGITIMSAVMYIAESILTASGAFFFNRGLSITKKGLRNFKLNEGQFACFIVSICILLMSFSTIKIIKISPARIIAVLIILFSAKIGKQIGGSLSGVAFGASMALLPDMNYLAAAYSVSGLVSGIFAPSGQLGVALAFASTNAIVSLYMQNGNLSTATLIETGIATIIFVIIPSKYINKAKEFFSGEEKSEDVSAMRRALSTRLSLASKAVHEVSDCVDEVSKNLIKIQMPNIAQVYTTVQNKVCSSCSKKEFCWQINFNDSMNVFNDMGTALKSNREISRNDVPLFFSQRCDRLNVLINTLTVEYNKQVAKMVATQSNMQIRGVVSEQFESVSDLLDDLANEFNEIERFDDKTAFKIEEALRRNNISPISVNCVLDKYERMKIEIHCPELSDKTDRQSLSQDIEKACERKLLQPNITQIGSDNFIIYSEMATYRMKIGHAQLLSNSSSTCGDCFDFFDDGTGKQIMLISDGMGTGNRAAIDGNMASSLMSRLIKAGFSFNCALKVVNSALLLKSEEESFATLDIVSFDLFTGKADFFKAGAPISYIKHKNKVKEVEMASLPAGILKEVRFERKAATLSKGDIVLIASDGAITSNNQWINTELSLWDSNDAQALAQSIAKKAYQKYENERSDDITVLVGIVQ